MTGTHTVARWRRFGHDRLYVERADGTEIGWWDHAGDAPHPASPGLLDELRAAIQAHRCGAPATSPSPENASATRPTPAAGDPESRALPEWADLAGNEPGAAVRAQAIAARRARPVRTFLARLAGVHTEERAWRRSSTWAPRHVHRADASTSTSTSTSTKACRSEQHHQRRKPCPRTRPRPVPAPFVSASPAPWVPARAR